MKTEYGVKAVKEKAKLGAWSVQRKKLKHICPPEFLVVSEFGWVYPEVARTYTRIHEVLNLCIQNIRPIALYIDCTYDFDHCCLYP